MLRHIANLWTLIGHPSTEREWSLDKKLCAIKEAGFDGVCWAGSPERLEWAWRVQAIGGGLAAVAWLAAVVALA